MDGSRFDAWTRRRFGLTAGGFAASLAALAARETAAAKKNKGKKKRKRKKRCKKLRQRCQPGGKRKCCRGNSCQSDEGLPGTFTCCKPNGAACSDVSECCLPPCMAGRCGVVLP